MDELKIDVEELITKDIAAKLLETIPVEQRQQILEASLNRTLENVLTSWNVERALKVDVEKYMVEYLKKPEVQERIKQATIKGIDELMNGVVRAIVIGAQNQLQNTYTKLIKEGKA